MVRFGVKFAMILSLLAGATAALGQVPLAFDPCAPSVGEAPVDVDPTFKRLCPDDLGSAGILISGASAKTHRELARTFSFDQPSDVTTDRIRAIGQELSRLDRYDDISIQPVGNRIEVILIEKPQISAVSLVGNSVFSDQELLLLANLSVGDPFVREIIVERSQTILLAYQDRGYFSATITPEARSTASYAIANGLALELRIEEGGIALLSEVLFSGNEILSDAQLRAGLTSPSLVTAADLSEDIIAEDQQKILQAYEALGLGRTNIAARIITLQDEDAPTGEPSDEGQTARIALVFDIEEREGFRIDDIEVSGAETDSGVDLNRGDRFDPDLIAAAARSLAEDLNRSSEIDLGVRTEFDVNQESGEVDVIFVVFEISPKQIASIRFTGNEQTAESYLLSVLGVEVGSAISSKELQAAVQRLGNTGLFEDISLSEDPAAEGQIALVVNLEEVKTGVQRLGVSQSSLYGLSLTAGVEERNWRGQGLNAGASMQLAEDRAELRFFLINPRFRQVENRVLNTELTLRDNFNEALDYSTSSVLIATSLTTPLTERLSDTWTLSLDISEINSLGPLASMQAQEEAGKTRTQLALSYGVAWMELPREDDPNAAAQASSYLRLFYPDRADPYARLGGEARYIQTVGSSERTLFTARTSLDHVASVGGGSQLSQRQRLFDPTVRVRGFEDGGLAPIERDGSLVGGDIAFGASLQLQYHLVRRETLPIYSSLFLDAGTVFDRGEDYSEIANGITTKFFDSSDLRLSTGVGLSLQTAAGVLTLSYAVPQSMQDFDREQRFQFSLGGSL